MNIAQRMTAPTPKFFRIARNLGLILAAVGGTLLATPIAVPAIVVKIAGYMTLAGGVLSAVSQATVENEDPEGGE